LGNLKQYKLLLLTGLLSLTFSSCFLSGKLPEGESFNFEEGEIVYYKVDQMPMLVEKQIVKKGEKYYKVLFKHADGHLMENVLPEKELSSTPPVNRAKI
jgi:hypothetical protein